MTQSTYVAAAILVLGIAAPGTTQELPPGGLVQSVPQLLQGISASLGDIENGVRELSPTLPKPLVQLATSMLFQNIANSRGAALCQAVNITTVPLDVTISLYDRAGDIVAGGFKVVVGPKESAGVETRDEGGFWCEVSFAGASGAVRANLAMFEEVEGDDFFPRPLVTSEAR
jgi:hypothetical protein